MYNVEDVRCIPGTWYEVSGIERTREKEKRSHTLAKVKIMGKQTSYIGRKRKGIVPYHVVPVIAQHNGMALYYCCLAWYKVAACLVVLWPQSLYLSRMNQRGHWVCWMTSRKNGLM